MLVLTRANDSAASCSLELCSSLRKLCAHALAHAAEMLVLALQLCHSLSDSLEALFTWGQAVETLLLAWQQLGQRWAAPSATGR